MRIELSERAGTDLLGIYRYVAKRNPSAAEAVLTEIDRKFDLLKNFPLIGRDRSALRPGIRSILAHRYPIFYELIADRVVVVRVLDGRRDIDAEFRK